MKYGDFIYKIDNKPEKHWVYVLRKSLMILFSFGGIVLLKFNIWLGILSLIIGFVFFIWDHN